MQTRKVKAMNRFVKSSILGALIALGSIAGAAQTAQAGVGIGFHFDSHGHGGVHVGIGHHGKGKWGHGKWGKGKWQQACSQNGALHRAASLGVKKRWVQHVGNQNITVRGVKYGKKVRVVISRHSPHCSVKTVQYV